MTHSSTFPGATTGPTGSSIKTSGGNTLHGSGSSSGGASMVRGGIKNSEGPLSGPGNGILASIHQAVNQQATAGTQTAHDTYPSIGQCSMASMRTPMAAFGTTKGNGAVDEETLEMFSQEMSFSALYMHELHRRRINNPYYDNYEDIHARNMWQSPPGEGPSPSHTSPQMVSPHIGSPLESPIQEVIHEEDDEANCSQPLLDFSNKSQKPS